VLGIKEEGGEATSAVSKYSLMGTPGSFQLTNAVMPGIPISLG